MAFSLECVKASGAVVATGQTTVQPIMSGSDNIGVVVPVTASSGTPNVVISLLWSPDGALLVPSDPVDAMTALTVGTSGAAKLFAIKAPFYQVVWTVTGGSPSMTFAVFTYTIL